MGKEEFIIKTEEIDSLAMQYEDDRGNLQLRERIWLLLWDIRKVLFRSKKIRGYLSYPPSGMYESGEEFLTEVFLNTVPKLLNTYRRKGRQEGETADVYTFMQYFNYCFPREVKKALADLQDGWGYLVVKAPSVPVFREAREDAVLPDTCLKCGMERRIIGRVSVGAGEWIKTELSAHGRIVFVREADVDVHEWAAFSDIDDEPAILSSNRSDGELEADETYEAYILNLLTLAQRLYGGAGRWMEGGFTKRNCFKLLYTEKLLDDLKKVYDTRGKVDSRHERDSLSAAETEFMDCVLTDICRDFPSIAITPFHACRDFTCLKQDGNKEIQPPFPAAVYAQFLVMEKELSMTLESVKSSLSRNRKTFKEQYDLFARQKSFDGGVPMTVRLKGAGDHEIFRCGPCPRAAS